MPHFITYSTQCQRIKPFYQFLPKSWGREREGRNNICAGVEAVGELEKRIVFLSARTRRGQRWGVLGGLMQR